MSLRASTSAVPAACSGDINAGVPAIVPSPVSPASALSACTRTKPKSKSLVTSCIPPIWQARILAGLISRCTRPTA